MSKAWLEFKPWSPANKITSQPDTHTPMHIHTHTPSHTPIHPSTHTYTHTHAHIHTHIHTHTHTSCRIKTSRIRYVGAWSERCRKEAGLWLSYYYGRASLDEFSVGVYKSDTS